jgi:hypothetical protein
MHLFTLYRTDGSPCPVLLSQSFAPRDNSDIEPPPPIFSLALGTDCNYLQWKRNIPKFWKCLLHRNSRRSYEQCLLKTWHSEREVRGVATLKAVTLVVVIVPVTIGATGTILKSSRQYLSNLPGKYWIKGLQTSVIFGTAHTHCGKC